MSLNKILTENINYTLFNPQRRYHHLHYKLTPWLGKITWDYFILLIWRWNYTSCHEFYTVPSDHLIPVKTVLITRNTKSAKISGTVWFSTVILKENCVSQTGLTGCSELFSMSVTMGNQNPNFLTLANFPQGYHTTFFFN